MSDIDAAWQYWSLVGRQNLRTVMQQAGYTDAEIAERMAEEEAHIKRMQEFCVKPFKRRPWWKLWP